MSVRMRNTRGHTGNRRAHHALTAQSVVKDKESGNLRLPHRLDEATGMYRGKQISLPKVKAKHEHKTHGPNTEPLPRGALSGREAHANAEVKRPKGIFERIIKGGRPKARSGFGGGA